MKKFSLLVGALGGALAGYVLSNETLRHQLAKAKNAEAAAKVLGSHLTRDGKRLAKDVKIFVESDDVQRNLRKAKAFASKKLSVAQKEIGKLVKKGAKQARSAAKRAMAK